jgi:putative tricarboxylic transport membrane protein
MGKIDQMSSLFWFLLGWVLTYLSHRLGLGTLTNPGPGFLPFWCGLFLSGLSLVVFLRGRLDQRRGMGKPLRALWAGTHWAKGVSVILALLIYTFAFVHTGFVLSTILLLIFLFKAIEPEKWMIAIGGAILASLVSFLVFSLWLDVQLPRGFIEKVLF